jgi:3-isopropylmalate dehydrogenase
MSEPTTTVKAGRIAVIPGDGVGIEVTREAVKVLKSLQRDRGLPFELVTFDWGANRYLKDGVTLPADALDMFRRDYRAIMLGAVGDPRVPSNIHAADILLGIRTGLDLYVNYRPAKLLDARFSPLKNRRPENIQLHVFRENTEGAYVGMGGVFKPGTPDEVAVQEDVNTRKGVERILVYAFDFARRRGLKRLVMSDKSNAMPYGHGLWQRTFAEIRARYPEVESRHLFVDALAMELVRDPSQFQVIVTNNMFGDILSDLASQLAGGIGLAPSANLHPGRVSMFEPVHGSAPQLAGKNVANPMGAILSAGLMLDELGFAEEARRIEGAIEHAVRENVVTADLGGAYKTDQVGDWICRNL